MILSLLNGLQKQIILYLTYGGEYDDVKIKKKGKNAIVLGAGPYRIGSSVEFDWGTVNMVDGIKRKWDKKYFTH